MVSMLRKIFGHNRPSEPAKRTPKPLPLTPEQQQLKRVKDMYDARNYQSIYNYWLNELRPNKYSGNELLTVVISALNRLQKSTHVFECCNRLVNNPITSYAEGARNRIFVAKILEESKSASDTLKKALKYLMEVVKVLEGSTDENSELAELLMECHHVRGNIYRKAGSFERARKCYRKSQKQFQQHSGSIAAVRNHLLSMDIAVCHLLREDEENANRYLTLIHKAITDDESALYQDKEMMLLEDKYNYFVAWMYLLNGEIDQALATLRRVCSDNYDSFDAADLDALLKRWALFKRTPREVLKPSWREDQNRHFRSLWCVKPARSNKPSSPSSETDNVFSNDHSLEMRQTYSCVNKNGGISLSTQRSSFADDRGYSSSSHPYSENTPSVYAQSSSNGSHFTDDTDSLCSSSVSWSSGVPTTADPADVEFMFDQSVVLDDKELADKIQRHYPDRPTADPAASKFEPPKLTVRQLAAKIQRHYPADPGASTSGVPQPRKASYIPQQLMISPTR